MSGPTMFGTPRRDRRGLTLTLVFGAVLATGAATGSIGGGAVGATARQHAAGPRAAAVAPAAGADLTRATGVAWSTDRPDPDPRLVARFLLDGSPWSAFYTPQQYAGFRQELDGGYVGVGLRVLRTPGGTVDVTSVQAGSPARAAGVRPGETLRSVDGVPVAGLPVTEVVARLRGVAPTDPADPATAPAPRAGSGVRLVLLDHGRPRTVVLRRTWLTEHPVTVSRPAPGVERIAVSAFTSGSARAVRGALAGGGHRSGVLLDLRGDSGGLVTEAVSVASDFLDGGRVTALDTGPVPRVLDARPGGDTSTPLVVLVDGGTMSAAELLTGALQDRGRAVVVGSRTFGKGSVQMPSTLPDGSVAELTVGHYRTPDGHDIDGKGISPDVVVPPGTPAAGAETTAVTVLSGLGTGS